MLFHANFFLRQRIHFIKSHLIIKLFKHYILDKKVSKETTNIISLCKSIENLLPVIGLYIFAIENSYKIMKKCVGLKYTSTGMQYGTFHQ